MIIEIRFKFGKAPNAEPLTSRLTPVTVFVGPNNSGKSKVLNEIRRYCSPEERSPIQSVILSELAFAPIPHEAVEEAVRRFTLPIPSGQPMQSGEILYGTPRHSYRVYTSHLVEVLRDPNHSQYSWYYLEPNTLMLNGPSRVSLVDPQNAGDFQESAFTSLQVLFRDHAKRAEVRRILHEAFGLYFVVDPTHIGFLRIRFSTVEPSNEMEEQGIHEAAVRFHAAALPVEETSDGVKAFTGMITEIVAGDPKILLIDEPEAFLHPALSFQLGNELARISSLAGKNLFASTHSA